MNYQILSPYNETHTKSILEACWKEYIANRTEGTIRLYDVYVLLTSESNREEEYSETGLTISDFDSLVSMKAYPQDQDLRKKYQKAATPANKSAVLQEAYTQGGYIYLNINNHIQTNYRIQLNTLNNRHSLDVMRALHQQSGIISSAKFYARSPQCNKNLKVDKVLIYFDNKQPDKVVDILKSVTGLRTLEALPPFCKLAQTDDGSIYFGMAAEELPGESSFSLERSKDVFEYLTGVSESKENIAHHIRKDLFTRYGKDPVGFVNSCFDYVTKKILL